MKIGGGNMPKIAGRPISTVEEISPPNKLSGTIHSFIHSK